MISPLKTYEGPLVALLVLVFLIIRIPGTGLPLHQDEYKWPEIVSPGYTSTIEIPHPPLSDLIYRTAGHIVGYGTHFRFVPLFFGALNLCLLYYFVRMVKGKKEALIASLIWIGSYFSVLASLMVDTDGEILPFFFLLALIAYYNIRAKETFSWKGLVCLVCACVAGFLVKVSFLLVPAAIVADMLWIRRRSLDRKKIINYGLYALGGIIVLILLLLLGKALFPFFNLDQSLKYWLHFIVADRGWFQTFIQCAKAILYASPFLILIPFLGKREDINLLRPLLFFLTFAFIFYVILFDFSIGALDRYLQLLILPLTIWCSFVLAPLLKPLDKKGKTWLSIGIILAIVLILLQFLPHYVPNLHPKSEWISRILSLRWNFVYPFSGGSGPLGFYVSFLFMALAWIASLIALVVAIAKPNYKTWVLLIMLPIGIAYNAAFIEEYLVGKINGSAPKLLTSAVEFMKNDPTIVRIHAYNDNGGNEIKKIGKYAQRLYIDPKFETDMQARIDHLNTHKDHYFVLDVPRFNAQSIYQRYWNTCKTVYRDAHKKMSATLYDCRSAPSIEK